MIGVTHFVRAPGPFNYSMERLYEDVRAHLPRDIAVSVRTNRFPSRGLVPRLRDAWAARRHQRAVNHVTGDTHYLVFFLDRRRTILTIHDCVPLETRTGIRRFVIWLFWYWLAEKRCRCIVTISQSTRAQLLAHLRCDPGKIVVIHNCVSDEFVASPRPFNAERPRILAVGVSPNKNLERMAQALRGLDCLFVIVGRLSPDQAALLASLGVPFENHADLTREALLEQYRQCDMLLFASTYEGFGLPIVEANAVGRPVVAGNCWSMPEVAGDAACLVDPFDVAGIRAGVARIIEDRAYREGLVAAGFANARRFAPPAVAARYARLYREIAAEAAN